MKRLIVALLATGALSAAVEDGAALFSAAAVAKANKQLADVRQSTGKEVLFITTNDLGGKRISEYGRDIAMARKLNGMIIVISTQPRMLEIIPGRKTGMVFNRDKVQKTIEILKKDLRKNPNGALADSVQFIYETFKNANSALIIADSHTVQQGAVNRSESPSFGWFKWVIIIGVVLLIVRLIGYFMNRNASPASPGTTPGATGGFGGGGFFPSLMGGIFGAMAGHWIYDKFFSDHEDRSYHANDSRSDDTWRGDDNGDTTSGSGSDWGNDGGGDSGGSGDSGGGGDW